MTPHAKAKLEVLVNLAIALFLVASDVRDIHFKAYWVGPFDTFHFKSLPAMYALRPTPARPTMNVSEPGLERASGWTSFLDKCDSVTAMGKLPVSRVAFAANCTIDTPDRNVTRANLVVTSSIRADSVAWACCQLIDMNRQPGICSSHVVRDFERRYYIEATPIAPSWIVPRGSKDELEVIALLEILAESAPLYQVTCVEGFELQEMKKYKSTIFGCGSPNHFRSAFAGFHATRLRELLRSKVYLTTSSLNLMGLYYQIRENCFSDFEAFTDAAGTLVVSQMTTINFSANGPLYVFQMIVDTTLMALNALSVLQIVTRLVAPELRKRDPRCVVNFLREGYSLFLSSTLYRSDIVALMVAISQLLSWMLIYPNAVIWNWGNSNAGKVQGYLSSLRIWALVLVVVNFLWDIFAFFFESLAYKIAKRTFVAPAEIVVIVAVVSYLDRMTVFAIGETKVEYEKQRWIDATSFSNAIITANSYNPTLEFEISTPTESLYNMYRPLTRIVGFSVAVVFVHCLLKLCLLSWNPFRWDLERKFRVLEDANALADASTATPPNVETGESDIRCVHGRQLSRRVTASTRKKASIFPTTTSESASNASDAADIAVIQRDYHRLPLEVVLNKAIRARSLVRPILALDQVVNHEQYVFAPLALEFGVFVMSGRLKARWGFRNAVPPAIQVNHSVVSDKIRPLQAGEVALHE